MFSTKPILAGAIACTLMAGCSGFSQYTSPTTETLPQSKVQGTTTKSLFPAGTPVVYVADEVGTVYIYSQSGTNQKPIGTITPSGGGGPSGLAVDGNGNLYVGAYNGGTVSVYHQGQTTPYETLTGGGEDTLAVAVDSHGNVYSGGDFSGTVTEWAAGSTAPTSTLATGFVNVGGIAVDASGDVFVSEGNGNEIDEFLSGSTTPVVLRTDQADADGLALDGSQNLIVVNANSAINIYAPPYNATKPIKTLKLKDQVFAAALNAADSAIWYADRTKKVATQLTYPALKKVESTKAKIMSPYLNGIALYPAAPL